MAQNSNGDRGGDMRKQAADTEKEHPDQAAAAGKEKKTRREQGCVKGAEEFPVIGIGASAGGKPLEDYLIEHRFENLGPKRMLLNAGILRQEGTDKAKMLLAIEDAV